MKKLSIIIYLLSAAGLWAQSSVFAPSSLEKISLASSSKPVERSLTMKKWFPARDGREKTETEFFEYIKSRSVYVTPPLQRWLSQKYFVEAGNSPAAETWLLDDSTSLFIRHYDPAKKDLSVEIYSLDTCSFSCKEGGFSKQLQYETQREIAKYDPKDPASFGRFKEMLAQNNIVLRNYLLHELQAGFFDSTVLKSKYPQANLVTWSLVTSDKLIVRFAREDQDLNFEAISIPYVPYVSGAWSLTVNTDISGFASNNEEISSYADIAVGYNLSKQFYNSLGGLTFTNSGSFAAHLVDTDELEEPNTYRALDSVLVDQELYEYYSLFAQGDIYHDSSLGILLGWRALPGAGVNFLGFGNRYGFDPVLSTAFGYRYEKNEIVDTNEQITYRDIILSHRFRIGNTEYGSASFYWKLQVEYQHTLYTTNSQSAKEEFLGITDSFRINYLAQAGFPILDGSWKFYVTYLQVQLEDQLGSLRNHQGMLSFEARIL